MAIWAALVTCHTQHSSLRYRDERLVFRMVMMADRPSAQRRGCGRIGGGTYPLAETICPDSAWQPRSRVGDCRNAAVVPMPGSAAEGDLSNADDHEDDRGEMLRQLPVFTLVRSSGRGTERRDLLLVLHNAAL